MRTDAQTARSIEPCDRTTAGADRVHIHHRDTHREACDVALCANDWLTAFHQCDVARCAADIDGDDLAISGRTPNDRTADHARGRAGEKQPHRTFACN